MKTQHFAEIANVVIATLFRILVDKRLRETYFSRDAGNTILHYRIENCALCFLPAFFRGSDAFARLLPGALASRIYFSLGSR